MAVFNEFIYFNREYQGKTGDFSGAEEALTAEERKDYLQAYAENIQERYGLRNGSKKVISDELLAAKKSEMDYEVAPHVRRTLQFPSMQASLQAAPIEYVGWRFYTDRVAMQEGVLYFNDGNTQPIPCAKYTFSQREGLKKLHFKLYVDCAYKIASDNINLEKAPLDITTGRIVEVRSGLAEVLKLQFYADGRVFALVGKPDKYHHKKIYVGMFTFNEWTDVEITFRQQCYDVRINDDITSNVAFTEEGIPDTLFFSGGRHPVGEWRIQPICLQYDDFKQEEFFLSSEEQPTLEETLGEQRLPFGVGGYQNRDKTLILRKTFFAEPSERAVLTVDTLSPGGEIYLNGVRVCRVDGFMRQSVRIEGFLREGENQLELRIAPRAPEILYSWHRCTDTYNAWFCGKVKIEFLPRTYIAGMHVITKAIGIRTRAKVKVALNHRFNGKLRLFLRKTNPDLGAEKCVAVVDVKGKDGSFDLELDVEPWSTESPCLYAVRVQLEDENGTCVDDYVEETGFRIIEQRKGAIYLNGEKVCLKGALIMQFLPPYENICKSHLCPTDEEIIGQLLASKAMNANMARLHILGYGTNDERFARYADRLGLMLIWTTSWIDSVECVQWTKSWRQAKAYARQAQEVINHPSIIMWEGCNELHADRETADALYDEFVGTMKGVDKTRLLCPCSHLYYGGGLYGSEGFYYQDDGAFNQDFERAESSFGWKDSLVVRSAHTYEIMLGYGGDWGTFRKQDWASQPALFKSEKHAYIVSEIAVIGRHDDGTQESQNYCKNDSYELSNERDALGLELGQEDWRISQAYQALSAQYIVKSLLANKADGIMWCCLSGGANDGSYLKPSIDFYGYAKYAFYALQEGFAEEIAFNNDTAVVFGEGFALKPYLCQLNAGCKYGLTITVKDEFGAVVDEKRYDVHAKKDAMSVEKWKPRIEKNGYYQVEYRLVHQ